MTDRVETIVCEPLHNPETSTIVISVDPQCVASDAVLLDDSWAEEFDRRLAAWEAESPVVTPKRGDDEPREI